MIIKRQTILINKYNNAIKILNLVKLQKKIERIKFFKNQ